jgi:hypothetical protein
MMVCKTRTVAGGLSDVVSATLSVSETIVSLQYDVTSTMAVSMLATWKTTTRRMESRSAN